MKVDDIITLKDGRNYGLLLEASIDNNNYFLAVQLDEKEEPTNIYKVLKEIKKEGKIFVIEEKDPLVLNELLEEFQEQIEE